MRRSIYLVAGLLFAGALFPVQGQAPIPVPMTPQPPGLLPPNITGRSTQPVVPAAGTTAAPAKPSFPADRFLTAPQQFPAETIQAVYSSRTAAEWLCRMHQPSGRFLAGVNAALARPLPDDHDLRQAYAALGVARAAAFTGDEKLLACASQAVLALLTLTQEDPADRTCRVPKASSDRCNRVGFASLLALAIYDLPAADPKLTAEADRLVAFLRKHCLENGSIHCADQPTDVPAKLDPEGAMIYPGLCLQALMASDRVRPEAWKRETVTRAGKYYAAAHKAQPHSLMAATLLPAFADLYQRGKSDAISAVVYDLADSLCNLQYRLDDAREVRWVGGFKMADQVAAEPTMHSATLVEGLACATRVAALAPDVTRFAAYRKATLNGLGFVRSLQLVDESTTHFDKKYRMTYLVGGVHGSPSDGSPRVEATAALIRAQLQFLASGAERGE